MRRKLAGYLVLVLLVVGVGIRPLHAADAVIGDGTPESCTEAALDVAFAGVDNNDSNIFTFDCGGAATITFTSSKIINATTITVDGGNQITLNGNDVVRHFYVDSGNNLTLKNITLSNGYDDTYGGGSILSLGGLTMENITIRDSNVDPAYSGGAIFSHGPVTMTNSLVEDNSGGSVGGLFLFGETAVATITNSTFRHNWTTNPDYGLGGAITTWDGADVVIRNSILEQNQARLGGAIYNESTNTAIWIEQNSILHNNLSTVSGGGIHNFAGSLTLTHMTLSNNTTDGSGGGLFNDNGYMSISDVTINNNYAGGFGGGLSNKEGTGFLTQVTINNNEAYLGGGGGIRNLLGNLILTNVTLSSNSAGSGGGIETVNSNLTITHVTFSGNISISGPDSIYHATNGQDGVTTVKNVIFQGTSGVNCEVINGGTSAFTSLGFNLSSDASCPLNQAGDQNNIDPILGPLADNGGVTLTHMLLADSPAIDVGSCVVDVVVDQRGVVRPQGDECDIGAVERQPEDGVFTIYLPFVMK